MNTTDCLAELGLPPGKYSAEDIKKAWKKKASEHHPDKGGDPEKFLEITHAYKIMTDPTYRHEDARQKKPQKPDLTVRMQIPVTFEEAFFGRTIHVSYNRLELGDDYKALVKEFQELIHVEIQLPDGSLDGHEVSVIGKGLKRGEEVGDLKIRVVPQPHPRFKHQNVDIITVEQVDLDVLLKGGQIEVQTMYGIRTVKVPAGTKPGAELRARGCGIMKVGDHIVIVDPIWPTKEKLRDDAWKGLDINWDVKDEEEDQLLEEVFQRLRTHKNFKGR